MFDFSKARKSSEKMENSIALSEFLNGYTSVSLYVHIRQHKKILCCSKTVVSTTKIFHIEVNVAH